MEPKHIDSQGDKPIIVGGPQQLTDVQQTTQIVGIKPRSLQPPQFKSPEYLDIIPNDVKDQVAMTPGERTLGYYVTKLHGIQRELSGLLDATSDDGKALARRLGCNARDVVPHGPAIEFKPR